jgi:hypothetical protein
MGPGSEKTANKSPGRLAVDGFECVFLIGGFGQAWCGSRWVCVALASVAQGGYPLEQSKRRSAPKPTTSPSTHAVGIVVSLGSSSSV